MNYIFMSESCISVFTDSIEAELHKHWMLQLFLSLDNNLNIQVNDENISCQCIIVNNNVEHCFYTDNSIHFTMLINATSDIAKQFKEKYLMEKSYCVLDCAKISFLQKEIEKIIKTLDKEKYLDFISLLFDNLEIKINREMSYDKRILKLLEMLDNCDCTDHSLKTIANGFSLSESRLSHLFKEQIGVPLKSYIVLHKVQRAYMYLLQNGNITDAAVQAGFDSPSHFAYTSKNLTGMSAKNIRKDSVFLKVSDLKIK